MTRSVYARRTLDPVPTALLVLAVTLAVLALLVAIAALLRLRAIQRQFMALWPPDQRRDALAVLTRQADRSTAIERHLGALTARVDGLTPHVAAALRHVAVVRYDAFGDPGGRLSFSAALLDDSGDGLVITSIHARDESRTYAKGVLAGRSEVKLTPEEQQAIAAARTNRKDA